jgi:hypothetical protein
VARTISPPLTTDGSSTTKAVLDGKAWFCHLVALPG